MIAPTRDEMRSLGATAAADSSDPDLDPPREHSGLDPPGLRWDPYPPNLGPDPFRDHSDLEHFDLDPPQEQKRAKIETEILDPEVHITSNPDPVQDYLERRAGPVKYDMDGEVYREYMIPEKEFYLLYRRDDDDDLYSRLAVNIMGTPVYDFPVGWSRDPTTDRQYVQLYNHLLKAIYDQVPSWVDLIHNYDLCGNMPEYEIAAFEHGTKFPKLTSEDIRECTTDLIKEKSLYIPRLKLLRDFYHYLLEERYKRSERRVNYDTWRNDDKTPFIRKLEAKHFERWLTKENIDKLDTLDEKRRKVDEYHKKLSDEDCSTRIRYVTLKLELAEKLGIISKEGVE